MIIEPKKSWLYLIFSFRDTVIMWIAGRVLFTTLLACVVTFLSLQWGWFKTSLTHLPFSFVGLALSIFLGFRNSTSYDRFWEGRKLWGQLVNTSRSFSRQALVYIQSETDAERVLQLHDELHHYMIAYVHAFRLHLREETDNTPLKPYLSEVDFKRLQGFANRPNFLMLRLSEMIQQAWKAGWLHDYHVQILEDRIHELSNLQGGCERIKATPIPFPYIVLLHRLVAIYCFALPFGIVDVVSYFTPFVVFIVSYAFMGLDAIGDAIENPFENQPHNLPLGHISKSIELSLRQQQGQNPEMDNLAIPNEHHVLM